MMGSARSEPPLGRPRDRRPFFLEKPHLSPVPDAIARSECQKRRLRGMRSHLNVSHAHMGRWGPKEAGPLLSCPYALNPVSTAVWPVVCCARDPPLRKPLFHEAHGICTCCAEYYYSVTRKKKRRRKKKKKRPRAVFVSARNVPCGRAG